MISTQSKNKEQIIECEKRLLDAFGNICAINKLWCFQIVYGFSPPTQSPKTLPARLSRHSTNPMIKTIIISLICIILFTLANAQTIDTLINVNGLKMHFIVMQGKGTPILFESGNGGDASDWTPVLNEIHKKTNATLITYDREGLGQSEIDTTKINFEQEIKNLEKGLKTLGYNKKIFLVSHSFGSFYSSLLAYRNKSKVTGAVFIDVATPCYFTEEWTTEYVNSLKKTEDWEWIKQNKIGLYYVLKKFPEISVYMHDRFIPSSIPLTLIRAENLPPPSIVKDEERLKWISCLQNFGELPNHKYVVAKNADHIVWEKAPQLVIDEISNLYRKVENKGVR